MLDTFFPLYITVFLICVCATFAIERRLIPILSRKAQQPIYEGGPKWHAKKSGTPTMGGVAFLISVSIALVISAAVLLISKNAEPVLSIMICQIYAALNACVGIIDDMKKLHRKQNQGLTPLGKLGLQFVLAVMFLAARRLILGDGTSLHFAFGEIELGIFYYPLAIVILLGIINCANLTDGIDGLASSVAFSIGVSLLYISAALSTETGVISSAIIGATVGFLIFNLHPAKIFMGDTGSLYFGSLIACCGFTLGNPILIIFIAGVYVLEGCSVILQVLWYKAFRRRIFRMAPFHHHLEQCGFSENRICIIAMILTFLFSIPAYIFYLP